MMFRFGQVERALQTVHEIASEKSAGFRARLRNLKRAGLNTGASGPGKRANLTAGDAVMLALAVELGQLGNSPERSAEILQSNLAELKKAVAAALGASGETIVLYFFPAAWNDLTISWADDRKDHSAATFGWAPAYEFSTMLTEGLSSGAARVALINLSDRLLHLTTGLSEPYKRAAVVAAISKWAGEKD